MRERLLTDEDVSFIQKLDADGIKRSYTAKYVYGITQEQLRGRLRSWTLDKKEKMRIRHNQMKTQYIRHSQIDWEDARSHFGLVKAGSKKAWRPGPATPFYVKEFLKDYKDPEDSYPGSYMRAMTTCKFAKLLSEKDPVLAVKLLIAM